MWISTVVKARNLCLGIQLVLVSTLLFSNFCLATSGQVSSTELATFIEQFSESDPAKVVAEIRKFPDENTKSFTPQMLVMASYAAAIKLDLELNKRLTDQLLVQAEQLADDNLRGKAYYNRGAAYVYLGNHDRALDAFLLSLASFENTTNQKDIARIKGGLAILYVEIGEFQLAQPYFKEALAFHKTSKDNINIARVTQNRGFLKIQLGQYRQAREDLLLALQLSVDEGMQSNFPILYKNLGKVESELGNTQLALAYLDKALVESTRNNLQHHHSEIMQEISRIQLKNGLLLQSRQSIEKSIQIGEQFNLAKQMKNSYLQLADLEVANDNYKAAYQAKEKAAQYALQMGNSRIASNLSRLDKFTATIKEQNKRLILQKQKQIALLAAEHEILLRNYSITLAVFALIIAGYFIRRFTHSNKQAAIFEQQSKIDTLTGVWNRRAGEAQLERLCKRDKKSVKVFSIAMLDIDNFKRVNDQFGHDVGDKVIISICKIIEDSLRPTDMLCRWGGEEFILILEKFDSVKAFEICDRIRLNIEKTAIDEVGKMTVSIGISMFENDELFDLVKRGDKALYHAKHMGRNQVIVQNKRQPEVNNKPQAELELTE